MKILYSANMTLYSKDEIDSILEYCCTSYILFLFSMFLCLCTLYEVHNK